MFALFCAAGVVDRFFFKVCSLGELSLFSDIE
jgi:hypothetical protein